MEKSLLNRCLSIGSESGLITDYRVRGQTVLMSPVYFADNNQGLADLLAKVGGTDFEYVVSVLKAHQGWPLSMIISQQRVSGRPLSTVQVGLIQMLAPENILKPPTIEIGDFNETFLFTPSQVQHGCRLVSEKYTRELWLYCPRYVKDNSCRLPSQSGGPPW
jgi:hypothetical protein